MKRTILLSIIITSFLVSGANATEVWLGKNNRKFMQEGHLVGRVGFDGTLLKISH